ncbi:hypothetical protein [Paracoccus sp. MC1862]|nr:hypothetical protein [Paracoccus sp. MC1862]
MDQEHGFAPQRDGAGEHGQCLAREQSGALHVGKREGPFHRLTQL